MEEDIIGAFRDLAYETGWYSGAIEKGNLDKETKGRFMKILLEKRDLRNELERKIRNGL